MKVKRNGQILEVDLHGMRADEASFRLQCLLDNISPEIREVRIIHGFNRGTALRDMVSGFKHPKIKSILKTLTDGQTRFIL